jgi:NADH dehydrogenase FAD-containing subunit
MLFFSCALYFIYYLLDIGYSEQINRRAIATDEWLRVEGTDNVYALGDCATINQRKVMVPIG